MGGSEWPSEANEYVCELKSKRGETLFKFKDVDQYIWFNFKEIIHGIQNPDQETLTEIKRIKQWKARERNAFYTRCETKCEDEDSLDLLYGAKNSAKKEAHRERVRRNTEARLSKIW